MKSVFTVLMLWLTPVLYAQKVQPAEEFWQQLQQLCGKSFEGRLKPGISHPDFNDKKLVMHVRACEPGRIRIPFYVGDNRSRTWVLTKENGMITLKHDHRHEDGSEDEITQYGGTATNAGFADMQVFPADKETAERIGYASGNVWWITLKEMVFSYNLKRIGSDREISVLFDLSNEVPEPPAPWGWVE